MSDNFIKFIPSPEAEFLQENHPCAFLLLCLIAKCARRVNGMPDGLIIGDAIICPEKAGLSRQQYRTAVEKLEKMKYIEIVYNGKKFIKRDRSTIKVTISSMLVNLCNSSIWDINPKPSNQRTNQRPTNGKELSKHKNKENIYKDKSFIESKKTTNVSTIKGLLLNLIKSSIYNTKENTTNQHINQRATNEQPTSNHKQEITTNNNNKQHVVVASDEVYDSNDPISNAFSHPDLNKRNFSSSKPQGVELQTTDNICSVKEKTIANSEPQSSEGPDKPESVKNNLNEEVLTKIISACKKNQEPFNEEFLRKMAQEYGTKALAAELTQYNKQFTHVGRSADHPPGWLVKALKNNYSSGDVK